MCMNVAGGVVVNPATGWFGMCKKCGFGNGYGNPRGDEYRNVRHEMPQREGRCGER